MTGKGRKEQPALINRAGKHLDPGQKAILAAAKAELRKLYGRI